MIISCSRSNRQGCELWRWFLTFAVVNFKTKESITTLATLADSMAGGITDTFLWNFRSREECSCTALISAQGAREPVRPELRLRNHTKFTFQENPGRPRSEGIYGYSSLSCGAVPTYVRAHSDPSYSLESARFILFFIVSSERTKNKEKKN